MDLLAQYSGSSGGAAGGGDDGEDEVGMMKPISAPKDIAPYVNTACLALVKDGDEQHVVNVADTQNLHGACGASCACVRVFAPSTTPSWLVVCYSLI